MANKNIYYFYSEHVIQQLLCFFPSFLFFCSGIPDCALPGQVLIDYTDANLKALIKSSLQLLLSDHWLKEPISWWITMIAVGENTPIFCKRRKTCCIDSWNPLGRTQLRHFITAV